MRLNYRTRQLLKQLLVYSLLAIVVGIITFPLFWLVLSAFKSNEEIFSYPPTIFPSRLDFSNFSELQEMINIANYFKNSAVVAVAATILSVVVSIPAAYSVTRFRLRGRKLLGFSTLFLYMLPSIMLATPIFVMFSKIRLANTLVSLILAHTTFSLPFCFWLLWAFFRSIPLELEEAAIISGATRFQAVTKIILPLCLPGIVAAAIFTFIISWNDYLWAMLLISSEELKTMPLALAVVAEVEWIGWGTIFAGCFLISVPPLIGFMFLQKYLIQGFGVGVE